MNLSFREEDEALRREFRAWLDERLAGPDARWAMVRGRGGPGDEHALFAERRAFLREMAEARWNCPGWPTSHGGRGATLSQQMIIFEEYARAGGPGRVGHIGEELLGPTLIAFGTEAQKARFLPPIRCADELWAQGYSEPNAGSDLANVQTRAVLRDGKWVINGQKVWTSLAHWAEWAFVIARTDPSSVRHAGLSYLLVPMQQPGVTIRPIQQVTGTSEFNEVFFDDAVTDEANVLGPVGGGWKVAMATLSFERGASTLGQQLNFENELKAVQRVAEARGAMRDPAIRRRLAHAFMGLRVMRHTALRTLSQAERSATSDRGPELGREAMIGKLYWATWHRDLGELAMDVLGPDAEIADGEGIGDLSALQRLFLFSRSDTIYAGTNEIQRNLIGERALGLPPEPKPVAAPKAVAGGTPGPA